MSVPSCCPADEAHGCLVPGPQLHTALERLLLQSACKSIAECTTPMLEGCTTCTRTDLVVVRC